jgi:hypothetical protein
VVVCATGISGPLQRGSAYNNRMPTCQIIFIKHKNSFRWKWRSVTAQGRVEESESSYELYYECVMAAPS